MNYFKLLFILLLFNSCKEDSFNDPNRVFNYGSFTALKNGEPWSAEIHGASYGESGYNGKTDIFAILVRTYNNDGYLREGLSIQFIPKKIGKGTLIRSCGANCDTAYQGGVRTISDDGDVICDKYRVVENLKDQNFVNIIEFNQETNEFSGTFSATYVIEKGRNCSNPNPPDTIRFTNGKFHSKITR